MTANPAGQPLWRVGYHGAPVGFTPRNLYGFSHRFDDVNQRFRTLYVAEHEVTCLQEVLADFRPNLAARQRHIERYGPEAAEDFPVAPVTAKWRRENVLVQTTLDLDGPVVDLFDAEIRQELDWHCSKGAELCSKSGSIALTDPAPSPLVPVTSDWKLKMQPAP